MRNEIGQPHPLATLFLHIVVKDYVPDGLSDFAEALANPIKYQSDLEKRAQQLAVLTDDMEPSTDGCCDESTKKLKENAPNGSPTQKPSIVSGADSVDMVNENDSSAVVLPPTGDHVVVNKPPEIKEEKIEEFVAEPLDKIMENKLVKEKKLELDKKLESLRKKYEKKKVTLQTQKSGEKTFTKFKKRFSKTNL